jgi:glycosyltransferase involved in cell wall biosynthesis
VPAVGCAGEDGPEELRGAGGGIALVPPRSPDALAATLCELLPDEDRRAALGAQARATVAAGFTWERCGAATLAAYRSVLDG